MKDSHSQSCPDFRFRAGVKCQTSHFLADEWELDLDKTIDFIRQLPVIFFYYY